MLVGEQLGNRQHDTPSFPHASAPSPPRQCPLGGQQAPGLQTWAGAVQNTISIQAVCCWTLYQRFRALVSLFVVRHWEDREIVISRVSLE